MGDKTLAGDPPKSRDPDVVFHAAAALKQNTEEANKSYDIKTHTQKQNSPSLSKLYLYK